MITEHPRPFLGVAGPYSVEVALDVVPELEAWEHSLPVFALPKREAAVRVGDEVVLRRSKAHLGGFVLRRNHRLADRVLYDGRLRHLLETLIPKAGRSFAVGGRIGWLVDRARGILQRGLGIVGVRIVECRIEPLLYTAALSAEAVGREAFDDTSSFWRGVRRRPHQSPRRLASRVHKSDRLAPAFRIGKLARRQAGIPA